jgi:hypothetical protein
MISGARYHLVTTYSVKLLGSSAAAVSAPMSRARPKSQIFRSQFSFRRMLEGCGGERKEGEEGWQ